MGVRVNTARSRMGVCCKFFGREAGGVCGEHGVPRRGMGGEWSRGVGGRLGKFRWWGV